MKNPIITALAFIIKIAILSFLFQYAMSFYNNKNGVFESQDIRFYVLVFTPFLIGCESILKAILPTQDSDNKN